jgi:hypothetical protein
VAADVWGLLVSDSRPGRSGRWVDGSLMGRSWAESRSGSVGWLAAHAGVKSFSYFS